MDEQVIGRIADRFNLGVDIYAVLAVFALIFARTVPMVVMSPVFGGKTVVTQIKIGTAMILSLVLYPIVAPSVEGQLPTQGLLFWGLVLKELAVGALIGFVVSLVFTGIEAAGHMIDVQRGSAQASVLVPQLDIQGPVFAQLHVQMTIVLFFMLNLHHVFIQGYFESFTYLPISKMPAMRQDFLPMMDQMIIATGKVFLIGVQIATPILISIFMVDVVFGVANRIAPQVNVYFLAMPVKAYVGVLVFLIAFVYILRYAGVVLQAMLLDLRVIIRLLG